MTRWGRNSIRNTLLAYFVFFALAPVALVVGYNYARTNTALSDNHASSRNAVLSGVVDSVQARVADCQRIADLIYANPAVMELLARAVDGQNPNYWLVKQAMDTFGQLILYISSEKYLLALMIVGENGLDLRFGRETAFVDFDNVFESAWYKASLQSDPPITWPGLAENISTTENERVIPMVRPIYDVNTGGRTGTLIVLLKPQLFGNAYTAPETRAGAYRLTILGPLGQVIYTTTGYPPAEDFAGNSRMVTIDGLPYQQSRLVNSSGWRLIETAPMGFVEEQRAALRTSSLAVFLSVALSGLLLAFYLSRRITRPLDRLLSTIEQISRGRFDSEIVVSSEDEIGRLGSGIQKMQSDIKNLLSQAILREQYLKRAEIVALQAQINPHFIYNTLNTVRIMADMQNASGISHVVRALGRIIRVTVSSGGDKVTVGEELRTLEDYFYILRVRYKGTIAFGVDVTDDNLLKCRMLKFILQPLIENAVFHGIEPGGGGGTVAVRFTAEGDRLLIQVRDDGVGIAREKLTRLLDADGQPEPELADEGISAGLGVNNINRRIKMVYGEEYGLAYDSQPGEYTCVTVLLPREE